MKKMFVVLLCVLGISQVLATRQAQAAPFGRGACASICKLIFKGAQPSTFNCIQSCLIAKSIGAVDLCHDFGFAYCSTLPYPNNEACAATALEYCTALESALRPL